MEGWQKGAPAVIKMSSAGRENYFRSFPERKPWFQLNYPEHFGRSAAAATTSLKKVTQAKQLKQRLAAIRQAAEKRNQLKVSSNRVRAMGDRRRESGEGMGGGRETNADLIRAARDAAQGGEYLKSGGLGSLFEETKKENSYEITKTEDGKFSFRGTKYETKEEAQKARDDQIEKDMQDMPGAAMVRNFANTVTNTAFWKDYENDVLLNDPKLKEREKSRKEKSTEELRRMYGLDLDTGLDPNDTAIIIDTEPFYGIDIPTLGDGPPEQSDYAKGTIQKRKDEYNREKLPVKPYDSDNSIENEMKKYLQPENRDLRECEGPMQRTLMPLTMRILAMKSKNMNRDSDENDDEDSGEYDYEGDMAKSQLRSIMHNSKMLHDMLEDNTNLPEWVQSKITLAEDYIITAANYMRGEMDEMDEMDEAANPAQQAAIAIAMKKAGKKPKSMKEEVEQIDEAQKKLKPYNWRAEWRMGTQSDVDKNNLKIFKKLAAEDPKKADEFQKSLMRLKKKDMKEEAEMSGDEMSNEEPPFEPNAQRPEMPPGKHPALYRSTRNRARKAAIAMELSQKQMSHETLRQAHMNLHAPQNVSEKPITWPTGIEALRRAPQNVSEKLDLEKADMGDVIKDFQDSDAPQFKGKSKEKRREMAIAAKLGAERKEKMDEEMRLDDLPNRSMLPDQSVIPPGKGFGDDIKRDKIVDKTEKAIMKKRMALPTDNPSENELVPQSMLPDTPGYPAGYVPQSDAEIEASTARARAKQKNSFNESAMPMPLPDPIKMIKDTVKGAVKTTTGVDLDDDEQVKQGINTAMDAVKSTTGVDLKPIADELKNITGIDVNDPKTWPKGFDPKNPSTWPKTYPIMNNNIKETYSVSDNSLIAATAGFLTNTSNRFLYGERK